MSNSRNRKVTPAADTAPAADSTATPSTNPNPLQADAQEKIAQVRALAASFPGQADQNALTVRERRLANGTPVQFLERAAQLAEAASALGATVDVALLRDAVYWELAYGGLVDQINTLGRQVEMAIVSRKLKAVKAARSLYQMAKVYAATDEGRSMKPKVQELKETLRRKRKTAPKRTPATETEDETKP